jgi:hypothetical protein
MFTVFSIIRPGECYNVRMANEPLISWEAPEHYHTEKSTDWYWSVGIITLALAAVTIILGGNLITAIFIVIAAVVMVMHVSQPSKLHPIEINDRGILVGNVFYPFLELESFCVPHDEFPPKLLIKSRRLLMPLVVIYIDGVDPEEVREIMLRYIAETQHGEHFLTHILERFGF